MALFKCKICGGTLEISNETVAVCEYCGTRQTLPRLNTDRRTNLYDRANHFRRNNEFDKAMGIYEQILSDDSTDAEAYWSLVLCRYGIEYVEDPATHKRLPTVNRAQYTSVFDDDNYKSALRYADGCQRGIYEAEARAINEIQKEILAISQREEPFDVFICYKETDRNGRRTPDSVLANDLYHQLTQEGFKVFFSRITLEDKLGTAYEPYIFAALNSAKVMVVLGTKPEYFSAVWVRNEWSRYLGLIRQGQKKVLIPAYKDMDPYDLPEEFSHLQAQDMSKLGFMQDLLRGIRKITQEETVKVAAVQDTIPTAAPVNVAPLLERVFIFLEDGDWTSANEYCEKVLDIEPKNAQAYLGKLMSEQHCRKKEDLKNRPMPFGGSNHYQKIMRFGNVQLKETLEGYIDHIIARNENARLEKIYNGACGLMTQKPTEAGYLEAADAFETIRQYKDAAQKAKQCREQAEATRLLSIYARAHNTMAAAKTVEAYLNAAKIFASLGQYRDAAELAQKCCQMAEDNRKDAILFEGKSVMARGDISSVDAAAQIFQRIPGWRDADACREECLREGEKLRKDAEQKRVQEAKARKRRKRNSIIGVSAALLTMVFVILLVTLIIPTAKYNEADAFVAAGEYEAAMEIFRELNFKDSYDRYCQVFTALKNSYLEKAEACLAAGENVNAAIWYRRAGEIRLAEEALPISSMVYTGEYIGAGIMADGSLRYQSNHEYDRADPHEDLSGIAAFLDNRSGVNGVDSEGRLLTHSLGTFDRIVIREDMHIQQYDSIVSVVDGIAEVYYVVMLRSDGTVVQTAEEGRTVFPDLHKWKNIVSIQYGSNSLFGIDTDGRVYQSQKHGANTVQYNVSELRNVRKLVPKSKNLVVLTADGTVAVLGEESVYTKTLSGKSDVQDVISCRDGVLILYRDGTVEMNVEKSTSESYGETINGFFDQVKKELNTWHGIVSVQTDASGIIGIRYDGTVRYVSTDIYYVSYGDGDYKYSTHEEYKDTLESWTDIVFLSSVANATQYARDTDSNWTFAIGIRYDGTAVSFGDGTYYTTEKNASGNGYHSESHTGGIYHKVEEWKFW